MENWRDRYYYAGDYHEGRAWVRKGKKYGHVDLSGVVTTPIIYDYTGNYHNCRAWVRLDKKCGHVDLSGKFIDNHQMIKDVDK